MEACVYNVSSQKLSITYQVKNCLSRIKSKTFKESNIQLHDVKFR